jgi:hypothetical protein
LLRLDQLTRLIVTIIMTTIITSMNTTTMVTSMKTTIMIINMKKRRRPLVEIIPLKVRLLLRQTLQLLMVITKTTIPIRTTTRELKRTKRVVSSVEIEEDAVDTEEETTTESIIKMRRASRLLNKTRLTTTITIQGDKTVVASVVEEAAIEAEKVAKTHTEVAVVVTEKRVAKILTEVAVVVTEARVAKTLTEVAVVVTEVTVVKTPTEAAVAVTEARVAHGLPRSTRMLARLERLTPTSILLVKKPDPRQPLRHLLPHSEER